MRTSSDVADRQPERSDSSDGLAARTLGVGVLGGGFMATVHSRAARAAGSRLTAIASSTPDRSRRAAHALGFQRAATDIEDLLQDPDVEVVHVCTPNAAHLAHALAALRAGKHVVCEKPLATTSVDARQLTETAAEAGVVAAVPFVYRYHPMVREARALVAAGQMGTVLTVDAAYLQDWLLRATDHNWRTDAASGGQSRAFADIGSHLCDLIEFVSGERVVGLTARTRTVFGERAGVQVTNEDIAALLITLDSGALGTLLVSQVAPGRKNSLIFEMHGTEQSVRFEQERPEELWIGRRDGSQHLLRDPATSSPDAARLSILPAGHPLGYQDAFTGFVDDVYTAIRTARIPEGLPVFADGWRAAQLTEAVVDSASHGAWIDLR